MAKKKFLSRYYQFNTDHSNVKIIVEIRRTNGSMDVLIDVSFDRDLIFIFYIYIYLNLYIQIYIYYKLLFSVLYCINLHIIKVSFTIYQSQVFNKKKN